MTQEQTNNMTQQKSGAITRDVRDYTHRQKAVAKLKKSGIVFPSRPDLPEEYQDEDGGFKMPDDITQVDYKDLGRLMSILNGLLQWYGAVLATAKVDKLTAERVKTFTEAKVRMEIFDKGEMEKRYKAREDKEAYVNINDLVIQTQDWYDSQESAVIMSEQLYKDFDRSFQLVSREITRRGGEFGKELRETNLR